MVRKAFVTAIKTNLAFLACSGMYAYRSGQRFWEQKGVPGGPSPGPFPRPPTWPCRKTPLDPTSSLKPWILTAFWRKENPPSPSRPRPKPWTIRSTRRSV